MKIITAILLLVLCCTQYELWFSNSGIRKYIALKHQIAVQQEKNAQFDQRNKGLIKEINNLKQGRDTIEEHARNDLGMIKQNETFYRIIPKAPPSRAQL